MWRQRRIRAADILRISTLRKALAIRIRASAVGGALLAAGALTGCTVIPEQATAIFSTSPGKYNVYTCQDMEPVVRSTLARHIELEQLMARSAQGGGGSVVNAIAYRTEYEQAGSDLKELQKASADKQCAFSSRLSSGRAVF